MWGRRLVQHLFGLSQTFGQGLSLTDGETVVHHLLGQLFLQLLGGAGQNGPGMTGGEPSLLQQEMNGVGQGQEPQNGHGGAGLAHPLGGLLLCESVFLNEGLITGRLFNGVQVFPLEVFNETQLHDGTVVGLDDDRRNLVEAGQLGSPPAAFAGDDLVIAGGQTADGEGLDDPVDADGIRQIGQ